MPAYSAFRYPSRTPGRLLRRLLLSCPRPPLLLAPVLPLSHRRHRQRVHVITSPKADGTSQPFVIGVTGGTASGKTTMCDMIIQQLHDLSSHRSTDRCNGGTKGIAYSIGACSPGYWSSCSALTPTITASLPRPPLAHACEGSGIEVLGHLDIDDACSAAASCRSLHATANAAISAVTTIDLSAFGPSNAILSRILAGNGMLLSLTVNCSLLDDSAASIIAKGSLRKLSLLKCSFTTSFFLAVGKKCRNLRSLKLEMAVAPVVPHSRYSGFIAFLEPIYEGCGYLEFV